MGGRGALPAPAYARGFLRTYASYLGLVNNKHPLIPLSTLQAGYRLLLHGLAAECLHATLVQLKRRSPLPA